MPKSGKSPVRFCWIVYNNLQNKAIMLAKLYFWDLLNKKRSWCLESLGSPVGLGDFIEECFFHLFSSPESV